MGCLEALGEWYAARSAVRRLWAVRDSQRTRIVIALVPTNDGDEVYPAWLANAHEWTRELQLRLGAPVQLEVMDDPLRDGLPAGVDGLLVADLSWRDSSMLS